MKKIYAGFVLALITTHLFTQDTLSGIVTDGKAPLPFCNVLLLATNSVTDSISIITGEVTDDQGAFLISAPSGKYHLRISFIGYMDYSQEVVLSEDLDLGNITLALSGNQLEEVVITAQQQLVVRKADRFIYKLGASTAAIGSDMTEALALAPGVTIQNRSLSIIGRGAARVMIDGRILQLEGEDLFNYLSTIASDDIETIEVITNPPAQYEAAGNGGLINIIYKKGRNNSWKNATTVSYTKNRNGYGTIRNNFQYNQDQHKVVGSLNVTKGDSWNTEFGGTFFPSADQVWNSVYIFKEDQVGGRLAYDYHLNKKNQIGIQYQSAFINPDVNGTSRINLDILDTTADTSFVNSSNDDRTRQSHVINVHYIKHLDTSGRQLSMDADYFVYEQNSESVFDVNSFSQTEEFLGLVRSRTVHSTQQIKNYSIKADMNHPAKQWNWNYGLKYSQNISDNELINYNRISDSIRLDPSLSNIFKYKENISSAYLSGAHEISKIWNIKLGLRLEHTKSTGYSTNLDQESNNSFTQIFPTAYLGYNPNEMHQYSLSMGGRVNRAGFRDLNPFRIYLTNTAYSEGNPFIQPSYTYTSNFNYVYKGRYTTTAYYNRQINGFGTLFVPFSEDRVLATLRDNYYDANYLGIGEIFSVDVSRKWSIQNQAYLMYHHISLYDNYDAVPQNGLQYYLSSNHNVTLSNNWHVNMNAWYNSSAKSNIFKVDALWSISLGIKKKVLDGKLQFSLQINDIFDQSSLDHLSSSVNEVMSSYGQNYSNRNARISIMYNLGNDNINVRNRKFGNEETQRRS